MRFANYCKFLRQSIPKTQSRKILFNREIRNTDNQTLWKLILICDKSQNQDDQIEKIVH